nr:disintegrin and metalloproteinase domain-containing protein 5 [Desmodus rotundus]
MGSDVKAVTQKVIQIIGFVNTMLAQLKLTVIISAIEIWSNKNKISTVGNPNYILFRFLDWKSKHALQTHHVAYLLAFKKQMSFIGAIPPGRVCNKDSVAGVALYPEGSSLEFYTVSIVQMLSLNMGLSFDNTDICYCSGDVCTMSPEAMHSRGVKDFSTCSLDEFKYFASTSGFDCLHNMLAVTPVYKEAKKVCGNGKLEAGEQCDCGTTLDCTHKTCCDATSCRLKPKKQCGSGECCTKDCKLKPGGTVCRKAVDIECDFTDYCNGYDSHCVPDTFVRNGKSCNSGEAHCFEGRCRTFDKQCKSLIGGASRGAPFDCFEEINSAGDRYGNCGSYYCPFPHMLCGKLVCTWPHKTLISRANLSVIYTHVREEMCVSTYLNTDRILKNTKSTYSQPEDRDETFVEDGSTCGPEMMCLRFQCLEIKYMFSKTSCDNSRHCNSRGICNNFDHCHCDKGFAPPNCTEMRGQFGSLDDGHRGEASQCFSNFINER